MTHRFLLLLLAVLTAGALARAQKQPMLSHPLALSSGTAAAAPHERVAGQAAQSINILAVRVEFQEDTDTRTSGNGRFDLTTPAKQYVDAPPRDLAYFRNHLAFVRNYFLKVSDGQCTVTGDVLDSVYQLPFNMQHYSPGRGTTSNIEIGRLIEDTWRMVDSLTPGIRFQDYNAFVIFHAGAGRDIDLASLYGFDPTPFDIPSLYVNLSSLQKMFGSGYRGVPVNGGARFITSTIVLPETENREISGVGGSALLKLGINGLFAASIGSHLGLPDLFDTKTGRSGIGRFGLMDGQSIFSWSGIFPPEPSPWEKYFLGWIDPVTVASGDALRTLPAVSRAPGAGEDTVYKVLINAGEYFLVENRNRDANRDGATVTMVVNGTPTTRVWQRDTTGFHAFNQDSLHGVVTDVDEFDWSLPSSTFRNEWYDGGILIWHIDEGVISANFSTGTVNADPRRRGVSLEEADGSEDIGQSYGFLTPGQGTEDGYFLDFWFAGNTSPARSRANEFSPATYPSSRSNDGANSHIYIGEFSARGPRMTARIRVGDDAVRALAGFPKNVGRRFGTNSVTVSDVTGDSVGDILVATNSGGIGRLRPDGTISFPLDQRSSVAGWQITGQAIRSDLESSGLLYRTPWQIDAPLQVDYVGKVFITETTGEGAPELIVSHLLDDPNQPLATIGFDLIELADENGDSLVERIGQFSVGSSDASPLIAIADSFILASNGPILHRFKRSGVIAEIQPLAFADSSTIVGVTLWQQPDKFLAVSASGMIGILTPDGIAAARSLGDSVPSAAVSGTINAAGTRAIALGTRSGDVYLLDIDLNTIPGFPVSTGSAIRTAPALADVNGDGQRDVIIFSGKRIFAVNNTGAMLDNFPVEVATTSDLPTSPIVANFDGLGSPDVLAVTREGLIVAYNSLGEMIDGFPLQSGPNSGSTPAAFTMIDSGGTHFEIGVAVASDDGNVYAWKTGTLSAKLAGEPALEWPQYLYDAQSSGMVTAPLTGAPRSSEFFPASLAYNWPNPVGADDGFITHIRYFVGENARVHIRIFDLAGAKVTEFDGPGTGGADNEVAWDVSGIQSGIYFAHIDAAGTTGSGNAVIKIAVVK